MTGTTKAAFFHSGSFLRTSESATDTSQSQAQPPPPSSASEGGSTPVSDIAALDTTSEVQYAFSPPPPLSEASMQKVDALFQRIIWLDMVEIHLLTKLVEDKLGLTAGGSDLSEGQQASKLAQAGTEEEQAEENLLKEVKLIGFDAKSKIKVIKEVRAIAELGLKEAKEMVESAPKVIQKDLKPEMAEELKARLEAVGAQVEIV